MVPGVTVVADQSQTPLVCVAGKSPSHHVYGFALADTAQDPKYDSQGNRQPPNNWLAIFGGVLDWQIDCGWTDMGR